MKKLLRSVVLVVLIGLTLFSYLGKLDPATDVLGGKKLRSDNDAYLSRSFNRAVAGFGVMSVLKAGLDIIEGSEVGASLGGTVQLEVGDVVQPAYDYVDVAWRTLLVGSVTLLGIRYFLQAAELIDTYVLAFIFLVGTLSFVCGWFLPKARKTRGILREVLGVSIVAGLAIYYVLPLSVWGASRLSRVITAPSLEQAEEGFEQTKDKLFPADPEDSDGWVKKVISIPERIEQIGTYLKEKTKDLTVWTIKIIAGYVFDCIVFPITLFILLLWLTRAVMRYVFQKNLQRSFREDLNAVFAAEKK